MNKNAIQKYAIWARNELIEQTKQRAYQYGIDEKGFGDEQADAIAGRALFTDEKRQRQAFIGEIKRNGYQQAIEEVAYTWFNRFAALRFMEVNDYLPTHVRVFSDASGAFSPEILKDVLHLDLDGLDKTKAAEFLNANATDELYRYLLLTQCNALNAALPEMFERMGGYTEMLLPGNILKADGVIGRLVLDIPEEDWKDAVQIIGWLYQYYITELNEIVYDGTLSKSKIPKELLPAATTIYTPDWAIRYMVDNSLGRLWLDGHPDAKLNLKYLLNDVEQTPEVTAQLDKNHLEYRGLNPEKIRLIEIITSSLIQFNDYLFGLSRGMQNPSGGVHFQERGVHNRTVTTTAEARWATAPTINFKQRKRLSRSNHDRRKPLYQAVFATPSTRRTARTAAWNCIKDGKNIDPCMGSGHILVYAFDVLMQIYHSAGYADRDATKLILENNLYGLDIDRRAYQLAYFSIMMKARQYNRRLFTENIKPQIYHPVGWSDGEECGSILIVDDPGEMPQEQCEITLFDHYMRDLRIWNFKRLLSQKYDVIVTNPPYLGAGRFSPKLSDYIVTNYADAKSDLSMVMFKHALAHLSKRNCFIAFITTTSWMYLSSFAKLRSYVLSSFDFDSLVDFGTELFEGKVGHNPIVAWVNRNSRTHRNMTAIRLADYCYSRRDEKESEFFAFANRHYPNADNFTKIPGSPVAYWVSEAILSVYERGKALGDIAFPKTGMTTGDNDRFLRLWYEINIHRANFSAMDSDSAKQSGKKWFTYCKGGGFRRWYGYFEYLVNWHNNGYEIKNNIKDNGLKAASVRSESLYFKQLITWSAVTSSQFSCRYVERGALFDSGGSSIFANHNTYYLLAILNVKIGQYFLNVSNATINYQPGDIAAIPVVFAKDIVPSIENLVTHNITLARTDWDAFETSWNYCKHPLM